MTEATLTRAELAEVWPALSPEERVDAFRRLTRGEAGTFFLERRPATQALLVRAAPEWEQRLLMRMLAPDDAADVMQELAPEERGHFLAFLDERTRAEVDALLAYAEDEAGGLMNPRFVRVRPDMSVDQAISYARRQSRERAEMIHYLYVLDADQKLRGVLSFRDLFSASGDKLVSDVMLRDTIAVGEHTDQEEVARLMAQHDVIALPVVDEAGRMRGIVTVDDVVDVVESEATEDIQKIGGSEALDKPYLQTTVGGMIRKRAPWLAILFLGEMLTASAMDRYVAELGAALVLAIFIPLIISAGGNSGSQATTLVIRAMALGEVRLRDWWLVVRREVVIGAALGGFLGLLGLVRVLAWQRLFGSYGEHALALSIAVGLAVLGVVTWGTLAGSTLPFVLRRLGQDPASASAPFVATLVDVSGLVIYFSLARWILVGTLL